MTPYEQFQQALIEAQARDDATWPEQQKRFSICREFADALLTHVRTYLGLPMERAEHLVYFRPHGASVTPDRTGQALQIKEGYYEIAMDVVTKLASGKAHALYAVIHIFDLGGTRYKIIWDGSNALQNEIEVDSGDPSTLGAFSSKLVHDILEFYKDSPNVCEYGRSRIGFRH